MHLLCNSKSLRDSPWVLLSLGFSTHVIDRSVNLPLCVQALSTLAKLPILIISIAQVARAGRLELLHIDIVLP